MKKITLELKQRKNSYFWKSTEPYILYGVVDITDNTEYGDGYFSITTSKRKVFYLDEFEYVKDSDSGKLYVEHGKWMTKSDKPIIFPKENYVRVERDGTTFMVCTIRQKALHTIGLEPGKTNGKKYSRNGKKFYKPYRNYFEGNDKDLDRLVDVGYMNFKESVVDNELKRTYHFTKKGLDWLGEQLGMIIKEPER